MSNLIGDGEELVQGNLFQPLVGCWELIEHLVVARLQEVWKLTDRQTDRRTHPNSPLCTHFRHFA
jgi:hypothetical protein